MGANPKNVWWGHKEVLCGGLGDRPDVSGELPTPMALSLCGAVFELDSLCVCPSKEDFPAEVYEGASATRRGKEKDRSGEIYGLSVSLSHTITTLVSFQTTV